MAADTTVKAKTRTSRSFSLRASLHSAPKLSTPRPKSSGVQPPVQETTHSITPGPAIPPKTKLRLGSPPRLKLTSKSSVSTMNSRGTGTSITTGSSLNSKHKNVPLMSIESLKSGIYFSASRARSVDELAATPAKAQASAKATLQPPVTFETDKTSSIHSVQPMITISDFVQPTEPMSDTDISYRRPSVGSAGGENPVPPAGPRGRASESFASFAHRSWNSPDVSRSPSPSSRDEQSSRDEDDSTTTSSISSTSPSKNTDTGTDSDQSAKNGAGLAPKRTMSKMSRRPLSLMFMRATTSESSVPALSTIHQMNTDSAETLPTLNTAVTFKKVKDELWEAFKMLENDYQRFQSKNGAQKATVIRQYLLPFLRKFSQHSSIHISPDELDKRVRTLHKWWTGLLAQLRNRNVQAVAGTDRPAYLEGISSIMSRPEWRSAPSSFAPISQRLPATTSSTSLSSASSAYSIQKSVQHNIRVLFTRTLFDTLSFAVEKMAIRTAPLNIVAFAGKVLAFAFYFCEGVAEMLVSLWGVQPAAVRRVLPEFGVGRGTDLRGVSEAVVSEFPETLHSLGFTTLAATIRQLKKPVKPPIIAQIDWCGNWTSRWCGRETDLLYIFLKHYHILMCDYLPSDTSITARLCAPAYVLVQAQILTLLDNTIHRQANPPSPEPPSAITFETLLANATSLPLPARNINLPMAENKLIRLLRDILADKTTCTDTCRELYFVSFAAMLKGAVKRTQLYDADACFALCDLMDEVLPIFSNAEKQNNGGLLVDWPFWIDVAKKILESENNMTELRLISFVYTSWEVLVEDESRKKDVCLEWLLSTKIWERFFCHWCPMVRAYFMRLICWRLGRYDGDASPLDREILETLSFRLRTGYAHHLRLMDKAENNNLVPPSTAPCLPAPSRRLVILRNDTLATTTDLFLEGIIPTLTDSNHQPMARSNSMTALASLAGNDIRVIAADNTGEQTAEAEAEPIVSSLSRRWSQIRNAFSFKSALNNSNNDSPDSSPRATRNRSSSTGSFKREGSPVQQRTPKPVKLATFKFSLEWMERPPFGVRDRRLGPARLAAPAQKFLDSVAEEAMNIEISEDDNGKQWTYVGRALAEWVLVIVEYENFFDRRKMEGRETDKDVETPTLGVESLRKF
ncbi:hypothetical protein RUND412_001395 [Rhizina undulata]